MHEYAPLAITLVAIFAGILVNKSDLKDLKADINVHFQAMDARLNEFRTYMDDRFGRLELKQDRMQADLSEFYRTLGRHEKSIEILERRK